MRRWIVLLIVALCAGGARRFAALKHKVGGVGERMPDGCVRCFSQAVVRRAPNIA